jgi:hypothetical protein
MILGNNENNVEFKKKNVWLEEKISSMSPRWPSIKIIVFLQKTKKKSVIQSILSNTFVNTVATFCF